MGNPVLKGLLGKKWKKDVTDFPTGIFPRIFFQVETFQMSNFPIIWEVAAWEDTLGKLPLGEKLLEKYLTPRETIANQTVHHKLVLIFLK